MSSFQGIQIGSSGLFMAQKQIDVTAHNLANANTLGYTRQRFVSQSISPVVGAVRLMPMVKGMIGYGVEALSLDQIRDAFLDKQFRKENSDTNYWVTKGENLYFIVDMFNAIGENGFGNMINTFFNAFSDLETASNDEDRRTIVLNKAKELVAQMHTFHDKLSGMQTELNDQIAVMAHKVNLISSQITDLNKQIFNFELSGQTANDLRDHRNLLIDELSSYVDITVDYTPDKNGYETCQLYIGSKGQGQKILDHYESFDIVTEIGDDMVCGTEYDAIPHYMNKLTLDGSDLIISSGQIKAMFDIRDGDDVKNQGIPYYVHQLDKLVESIVKEVNAIHEQGYTRPYDGVDSTNGIPFFDPAGITAKTIDLSSYLSDKNGIF